MASFGLSYTPAGIGKGALLGGLGCCSVVKFFDSRMLASRSPALILRGLAFLCCERVGSAPLAAASSSLFGSYQSLICSLAYDRRTLAPFFGDVDFDFDADFFSFLRDRLCWPRPPSSPISAPIAASPLPWYIGVAVCKAKSLWRS